MLARERTDAPSNPYAASKAAAEELVAKAHNTLGLNTVITRGSNTYGPRQFPEKIISLFVANTNDGGRLFARRSRPLCKQGP